MLVPRSAFVSQEVARSLLKEFAAMYRSSTVAGSNGKEKMPGPKTKLDDSIRAFKKSLYLD